MLASLPINMEFITAAVQLRRHTIPIVNYLHRIGIGIIIVRDIGRIQIRPVTVLVLCYQSDLFILKYLPSVFNDLRCK